MVVNILYMGIYGLSTIFFCYYLLTGSPKKGSELEDKLRVEDKLSAYRKNRPNPLKNKVSQYDIKAYIYRVIHKFLREFRTRLRNNKDRHGRKEHINR